MSRSGAELSARSRNDRYKALRVLAAIILIDPTCLTNVTHDSPLPNLPYGPATNAVRRFLVRFAALPAQDRDQVLIQYAALSSTRNWQRAETALAAVMERSGRDQERDAVSGPLLQLVRLPGVELQTDQGTPERALEALDPIAEPALAALLALIVRDLLESAVFDTLYSPMYRAIPLALIDD